MPSPMMTEDFESLPPAVRRKFFSNVERLRIRLDQSDHGSPACCQPHGRAYRLAHSRGPGPLHPRVPARRALKQSSSFSRHPRKLRKPGSHQLAHLATQADSQCFRALPAKLQQQLFSPEERRRLRRAYRESVILDAADQAFYRRDQNHRRRSIDSLPSESTLPVSNHSAVFWDSSDDESDNESTENMDNSFYDSCRWLDEDGDLDLSLDEYHSHVASSAVKPGSRRRPSFRRSMSFTSSFMRKPALSMSRPLPDSSHSAQPLSMLNNRHSMSRPGSRQASRHRSVQHIPKSSTSSIDPAAQYYQDPDARLKLRVYLASPQKFDEAIEFGFPAVDQKDDSNNNKENVAPEPSVEKVARPSRDYGTFFEDDDGSVVGSPGEPVEEEPAPPQQMQETPTSHPQQMAPTPPQSVQKCQSWLPGSKPALRPQRLPGNREMTLKMTLTRPDLRTESPTPSASSTEDPLRLAELPPADRSVSIWEDLDDHVVKKMWKKLRKRIP
ncbi:hypothetical protein N7510_011729 [Penicillium lagena]|uniref:uncharacterized protein n=1 Tax=Penicillium lagena TaxID=94218 RepID=UPI0025419DAC|nr:uncharacterized protein N7510_011729 [Penicillium lagena]KAJ5602195.1 hypothetical protein N7510_011729 [Penicillium lagena]